MIILIVELNQPVQNKSKAYKHREYIARNQAQCYFLGLTNIKKKKRLALKIKLPWFMQKFKWV